MCDIVGLDVSDMQENQVEANGSANGGYLHLSENAIATEDESLGYTPVANGVENVEETQPPDEPEQMEVVRPRSAGTVVNVNGVEVTVFGNIEALEFLNLGSEGSPPQIDVDAVDSEEEEEETRQRIEAERAIREANEAYLAQRNTPLPPEQCQTIRNAMRGITLGFQPEWAGSVPEQEWMSRLLQSGGSAGKVSSPAQHSSFFCVESVCSITSSKSCKLD